MAEIDVISASTQRRRPLLRKVLAEFVVIVLGVLTALAVDRWVTAIDDRGREQSYLGALRDDFESNLAIAESKSSVERELVVLADYLLRAVIGPATTELDPRIIEAIEHSGWLYPVTYARSAWDDLQATGSALVLSNGDLRRELARFYLDAEYRLRLEEEWLIYILNYRDDVRSVLAPSTRIQVQAATNWPNLQAGFLEGEFDLEAALRSFAATDGLAGRLVDVRLVRQVSATLYGTDRGRIEAILAQIDATLADL